MKLFLDEISGKPHVADLGESFGAQHEHTLPPSRPKGWLARKYSQFLRKWQEASHGPGARLRAVWHWLHQNLPRDESLLARLRKSTQIEVYYPDALAEV